jgi:hypothetical protein
MTLMKKTRNEWDAKNKPTSSDRIRHFLSPYNETYCNLSHRPIIFDWWSSRTIGRHFLQIRLEERAAVGSDRNLKY